MIRLEFKKRRSEIYGRDFYILPTLVLKYFKNRECDIFYLVLKFGFYRVQIKDIRFNLINCYNDNPLIMKED